MKKSMFAALAASTAMPMLASVGPMTTAERSKGRYMRDEGGHAPAPTPAPAPAATEAAPAAEPAAEPAKTTEQLLEEEFNNGPVDEPATPAPDADEAAAKAAAEEAKAKNPVQERIDEMTAARREAERELAEARRERDAFRAEVDTLKGKTPPASESTEAEPAAKDYEFGEADPKFIADTARFHARQEFETQRQVAEVRGQIADMEVGYKQRIIDTKITETHPDFDEKVNKGAERGDWYCPPIVALGIKASEFGPEIAYHLATNVDESKRIAALTPIEQAREFGILEGERRAQKAAKAQEDTPTPIQTTKAPTPPAARARGAGGKFSTEADTDDFRAFEAMADESLKGK